MIRPYLFVLLTLLFTAGCKTNSTARSFSFPFWQPRTAQPAPAPEGPLSYGPNHNQGYGSEMIQPPGGVPMPPTQSYNQPPSYPPAPSFDEPRPTPVPPTLFPME